MKPATILDVGSSKVVCLCGSMVDKDGIVVHGAGISTYAGFRDGAFLDKQSMHSAVLDCVHKTEQESRLRIRDVALTVPASFARMELCDATITLGSSRLVESADVDKLISLSLQKAKKEEGWTLMHSTPVFFMVDGVSSTEMPDGVMAEEISALVSHMFVKDEYIRAVQDALDDLGIEISMCVSAQLGKAVMLIPDNESPTTSGSGPRCSSTSGTCRRTSPWWKTRR